jgi:hypothetical protein
MKLDKRLLKKLIKEVIREAEGMDAAAGEETPTSEPKGTSDDTMKHSRGQEKKEEDTMIQLTLRGLKPGKAYKKVMSQMAHDAKMADLEVIHAELKRAGKTVDSMDIGELERSKPAEQKPKVSNIPDDFNLQNLSPEEQQEWNTLLQTDPSTLGPAEKAKWKEDAKRLYRLSKIRPGEKEGEWKDMTSRDVEKERVKARERAAKLAAGTLKMRPVNPEDPNSPEIPVDSSLWTDKEWDMATSGGEAKTAVDPKTGKAVYRPSFKKTDRAKGRTVFAPISYSRQ